jgi:hypothetical protein
VTVNQVLFKVPDLDALKTVFGRARAAGIDNIRQAAWRPDRPRFAE